MEKLHQGEVSDDASNRARAEQESRIFVAESLDDQGEKLMDMEKWEGGLHVEDVIASALNALEQHNLNKSTLGLADMHSKLVALAWSALRKSKKIVNPEDIVGQLLGLVKKGVQTEMRAGRYKFTNEDIFKHLGEARVRGMLADIKYLSIQEKVPEGAVRRHYSNAMLDNAYGIDYITTTLSKNVVGGRRLSVDLVQVKSNTDTVSEIDREAIIKKHTDFLRHYIFAFESARAKEAVPGELEKMIDAFGFEKGAHIRESWDIAHSESDENEALAWWRESLEEFKTAILADNAYAHASNAAKWKYVAEIGARAHLEEDPDFNSNFGTIFREWQRAWLDSIRVKMVRGLEAPSEVHYRLIIYLANGEREEYIVSGENSQVA